MITIDTNVPFDSEEYLSSDIPKMEGRIDGSIIYETFRWLEMREEYLKDNRELVMKHGTKKQQQWFASQCKAIKNALAHVKRRHQRIADDQLKRQEAR